MLQLVRRESSPIWIAAVAAIFKIPLESVVATDGRIAACPPQGVARDPDTKPAQGDKYRRAYPGGDRRRVRRRCLLRTADPLGIRRHRRGLAQRRGRRLRALSHAAPRDRRRSEEHTSELQSLMRISYAVFCLKKKINNDTKRLTYNSF